MSAVSSHLSHTSLHLAHQHTISYPAYYNIVTYGKWLRAILSYIA